ncbi:hypothetical protein CTI12_AA046860 [Artemisia annua]|uniref:Uncharacterized protein n=1 Tax=Artemisia annua TaxID=35608 RepID=A0A2U1QCI2_ARTAN|nr:hypothetical protein CTI12_AA046860 [Artemisia annua]
MTSSITVEPYETVEFSESDTDSWQVVDPFDSENDDVITTESDVTTSDDEDEDGDVDVVVDDVIRSESDVISSEYDEDEDEDEDDDDEDDEDEEDDVISSEEDDEEDEDDVITSEDEEEDDEDDVITPMSSDEMINHTQELNKAVVELDGPYNVEFSDSMKVDAYFERSQLERMLYEDAMKEDAYIKRMQLEEEEHDDEDEDDYDEDLDDELIPRWLNNKFERQRMRKLGKKVYPKMKKSKRMVNQYNRPGCAGAKHGLGLKHNLIG